MNRIAFCCVVIGVLGTQCVLAGPVEDLAGRIDGRQGSASEDRRGETRVLGVKTDCPGDTLEATVRIVDVSGQLDGDTARMTVTYQGEYTRQGWGAGCNRLPGRETGTVSGKLSFSVTGKPFQRPTIVWGQASELGRISTDANHDSNVFAFRAAQAAVASAF
jgi:hypothetical protein